MQAAMAVRQSVSHDRMRDVYQAPRSQSAGGMHPRSPRSEPSMENLAPMLMPSGLNSMLKNTTETGDIGMFSIKPTKLPRHNGSATLSSLPKAAYHDLAAASPDFSLFKGPQPQRPRFDDRRRLPSYNRDITSEVASLYETNSMKSSVSSRVFDDTEQRSYSMTQTSVNVSRLANHRSYASLRSQGDMGVGQRPRSPFAYPSRLKRPGFRPCSPALTDGGAVDYSKRAEIGRESSVTSPVSSNSVDSQRRMPPPPLSIRTDLNRSTPGLNGQPSPRQNKLQAPPGPGSAGRRSPAQPGNVPPSPLQREFNASRSPSMGRKSPAPLNQAVSASAPSPSRTVTGNGPAALNRLRSRASSSNTADKIPASPLYYDYTESFYPDDEAVASTAEDYYANPPAPAFMVDRTIHEDRELSSDWSYLAMTDLRGRGFLASEGLNLMPEEGSPIPDSQPLDLSYAGVAKTSPLRSVQIQPAYTSNGGGSFEHSMTARVHGADESNGSSRWNGAGYGSSEPTPLEERGDPNEDISFVDPKAAYSPSKICAIPGAWPPTANSVAGGLQEEASSFPFPSTESASNQATRQKASQRSVSERKEGPKQQGAIPQSKSAPGFRTIVPCDDRKFSPETVGLAISTTEVTEVTDSHDEPEDVFPTSDGELQQYQSRRVAQTDFPLIRHESYQADGPLEIDRRFKLSKYKSDSDLAAPRFGIRENNRYTIDGPRGAHHLTHPGPRNPREFCFIRSSSEIMSPIPISPARELRVKNSIPQFMKTLPPLPLRQPVNERIALADPHKSSSKRPPPLKLDPSILMSGSTLPSVSNVPNPTTPTTLTPTNAKGSPKVQKQFANSSQPFLSRWRLKARSPAIIPKPSPPATRPWNLAESYPWDDAPPAVDLPALVPKRSGLFNPKLKLKMMKSSESLGLGTVRVNRDAAQAHKEVPTLGAPKDLFSSPSSGLTNIFRQVSHHLSGESANASNPAPHTEVLLAAEEAKAKWNHKVTKSASKSTMTLKDKASFSLTRNAQQAKSESNAAGVKLVQTVSREFRVATNIVRPAEHGSLRHEGSQQELHDSIRKKLRARLPMSHSRAQSRKSEDMISRPKTAGSMAPLVMTAGFDGANDERPVVVEMKRSKRLKKKVSSWFKGAKATVLGCVRHKHGTEVSELGAAVAG